MAEFDDIGSETAALQSALSDLEGLADSFGSAMTLAFRRSVIEGRRLEDVLRSIALGLSSRALSAALAPLSQGIGGILSGVLTGARSARSGFAGAGAAALVRGGIAPRPAAGLGAAGLEPAAAQPHSLARRGAAAPGGVSVTFNVTTPDAQSFRRAEADITAMLARAVARGQRGL